MKKWKELFECTAAERRGILVLSLLVLLLLAVRITLMQLPPKPLPPLDREEYQRYLAFVERQRFLADSIDAVWAERRQNQAARYSRPRPSWYGSRVRQRPQKRETVFFPTADSSLPAFSPKYPEKRTLSAEKVELNRADTLLLRTIPGIGARTAREIVAYRERLGGFVDFGQLLEIRFVDSTRWRQLLPYLSLDTTGVLRKLHINQANVGELVKHPYIDYYLAKTIVVCRENKGRFRSLEEMRSVTRVYPELFERLKPYMTIK